MQTSRHCTLEARSQLNFRLTPFLRAFFSECVFQLCQLNLVMHLNVCVCVRMCVSRPGQQATCCCCCCLPCISVSSLAVFVAFLRSQCERVSIQFDLYSFSHPQPHTYSYSYSYLLVFVFVIVFPTRLAIVQESRLAHVCILCSAQLHLRRARSTTSRAQCTEYIGDSARVRECERESENRVETYATFTVSESAADRGEQLLNCLGQLTK